MFKKPSLVVTIIFIILVIATVCMYSITRNNEEVPNNGNNIIDNTELENNNLDLPTEGNDTVISTKVKTTLRVVNEYDNNFFTAKKNLLIMFASWCPNCKEEVSEIEKILDYYKDNKNVNVVLIAHEYDNTVTDLINLIENDVDFGSSEVKVDLKRIIRKTIDPEASTIPISYVVDKSGKVQEVHNESLTLEKAIEMIEK